MMDAIGLHIPQQHHQRVQVAQIALMKLDLRQDALDVSQRTPPPHQPVDFDLRKRR
jgi:hypothetical protein